jgi:hypothetical protein
MTHPGTSPTRNLTYQEVIQVVSEPTSLETKETIRRVIAETGKRTVCAMQRMSHYTAEMSGRLYRIYKGISTTINAAHELLYPVQFIRTYPCRVIPSSSRPRPRKPPHRACGAPYGPSSVEFVSECQTAGTGDSADLLAHF